MSKWTSAAPSSGFYFNGQALQAIASQNKMFNMVVLKNRIEYLAESWV
jgi:hypothetical protein